jgi:hypothetical protein
MDARRKCKKRKKILCLKNNKIKIVRDRGREEGER